jgi:hypothetical protein
MGIRKSLAALSYSISKRPGVCPTYRQRVGRNQPLAASCVHRKKIEKRERRIKEGKKKSEERGIE